MDDHLYESTQAATLSRPIAHGSDRYLIRLFVYVFVACLAAPSILGADQHSPWISPNKASEGVVCDRGGAFDSDGSFDLNHPSSDLSLIHI